MRDISRLLPPISTEPRRYRSNKKENPAPRGETPGFGYVREARLRFGRIGGPWTIRIATPHLRKRHSSTQRSSAGLLAYGFVLLTAPSPSFAGRAMHGRLAANGLLRRSSPITAAGPRWIRTTFPIGPGNTRTPAIATYSLVKPNDGPILTMNIVVVKRIPSDVTDLLGNELAPMQPAACLASEPLSRSRFRTGVILPRLV